MVRYGALARTVRAVAATSAQVPVVVVVIIDDADCLDEGLAFTLIDARPGRPVRATP